MTRPWSPAEVEAEVPSVLEAIDETVETILDLTTKANDAQFEAKKQRSLAWLRVKGSNRDEREARVFLHQVTPTVTVGDLEHQADLADGELRAARLHLAALQTKADMLRSLLVSARATGA